jgi:hypothetical protein
LLLELEQSLKRVRKKMWEGKNKKREKEEREKKKKIEKKIICERIS